MQYGALTIPLIKAVQEQQKLIEKLEARIIELENSNPNCLSDLGVSVSNIKSSSLGALYNISINLKDIDDETYKDFLYAVEKDLIRVMKSNGKDFLTSLLKEAHFYDVNRPVIEEK